MTGFASRLPAELENPVGPEGHGLSQGQAHRITIPRALFRDPRILVLGEPTSSLEPETEASALTSIKQAMQGRTTFAIAHRPYAVKRDEVVRSWTMATRGGRNLPGPPPCGQLFRQLREERSSKRGKES